MSRKIVVAGTASLSVQLAVDAFPVEYTSVCPPRWIDAGLGGAGAQIAAILRRLGTEVVLCSVVGRDPVGALVRQGLRDSGLDGPTVVDGPGSSQAVILVAPDGQRIVYPHVTVVNAVSYPEADFVEALRDADLAVITTVGYAERLLATATRQGVPIAVDVSVIADVNQACHRPFLEVADVMFCSHERLPCPAPEWIARIMERYPGVTVAAVGQGSAGSVLGLRDGRLVSVSAVAPLGVHNTAGAGDSLFAGWLNAYVSHGNPVEALCDATVYAGWRVGHRDPTSALLTAEELSALRSRYPVRVTLARWDGPD